MAMELNYAIYLAISLLLKHRVMSIERALNKYGQKI